MAYSQITVLMIQSVLRLNKVSRLNYALNAFRTITESDNWHLAFLIITQLCLISRAKIYKIISHQTKRFCKKTISHTNGQVLYSSLKKMLQL